MAKYKKKTRTLLTIAAICLLRVATKRRKRTGSVWTRSWISRRQTLGISSTIVSELQSADAVEYRSMFRMDLESFKCVLELIRSRIEKENTLLRESISPKERLEVTLRYLASGRLLV
jgi:hypothetical protein